MKYQTRCSWRVQTEMVILWNLNSRLAELGDILHLSMFCMTCNVNGNFMGLNWSEKRCYHRLLQMWNCIKQHSCILYFPFHSNVTYCMIRSLRMNVCIQPVNITQHLLPQDKKHKLPQFDHVNATFVCKCIFLGLLQVIFCVSMNFKLKN